VKKILLDARKIEDYGIGVYIRNLFQGILDSGRFECRVLHLKGTPYLKVSPEANIEISSRNYDWREQVEIPLKTGRYRDHLYFSPHYVFPFLVRSRLVVTVHDLIHFKFPRMFRPAWRVSLGKAAMRQVKNRARAVFTVSETTRRDLVEMFGFPKEKIRVVPNGVAEVFFRQEPEGPGLPFPYVLYAGNLKSHKNLPILLKAFSLLGPRYPELRLVLAGARPGEAFKKSLEAMGIADKVMIKGFLPQEELVRLIDGALFFVFPSLYEGFGLPPLEAMARAKPVLSSPYGSLKEVLGGNALYFRPESFEDLAEKMSFLLDNPAVRATYGEKGRRHSRNFRWVNAVRAYVEALEALEE